MAISKKDNSISGIINCYGCGVCSVACPKNIIQIGLNKNGFYEPTILDKEACTHCGICISVCSFVDNKVLYTEDFSMLSYAAWSDNEEVRNKCSSGGIGFEIGKFLLQRGYKACGVEYDVLEKKALHFITDNVDEYTKSIGSKYIQSYTVDAFSAFNRKDKYFVTGTPCQIDSLRRYIKLKKIEDNFVLLDFFCHGVPSMLMWKKYINVVEKKMGTIVNLSWRNKNTGWHDSWAMSVSGNNGSFFSLRSKGDLFYKMFLNNSCLAKACYDNCKFKGVNSSADIRIGDLWGRKYKEDEKGVSGVIVFTEKGKKVIDNIKEDCCLISEEMMVLLDGQMSEGASRAKGYSIIKLLLKTNCSLVSIDKIQFFLLKILNIHKILYRKILKDLLR